MSSGLRGPDRLGHGGVHARDPRRERPAHDQLHHGDHLAQGGDDHPPQRVDERRRRARTPPRSPRRIGTTGRCRCSAPTGGRSRGSTPPSGPCTCACARSFGDVGLLASERITLLCAAPTVLISIAHAPRAPPSRRPARGAGAHCGRAPRRCHDRACGGRPRWDDHPGVRAHGDLAVHHGVRGT